MIRVTLQGRLGNWLFQYAVGRVLALRVGTELALDLTEKRRFEDPFANHVRKLLKHFGLHARYEFRLPFSRRVPDYRETRWGFNPEVLAFGDGAWLEGLFQSPRYFDGCEGQLRTELAPRLDRIRRCDPSLEKAIASTTSVAVHVRRTDYVAKVNHHLCTSVYYERALQLCRNQLGTPHFYIFSDEPEWCRVHLSAPDSTVVDTRAEPRAIYDLALMSRCRHHIIANSTFSWWGAWLAQSEGQLVVAPDRWFLEPEPSALAMRDTVPAHWLRVQTQ